MSAESVWSSSESEGVLARLVLNLGTDGSGQVKSWSSWGQNGRIFSNRYHCRSGDKPFGTTIIGSDEGFGFHGVFINFCLISAVSHWCLIYTTPGSADEKRKWWYFFIPRSFFMWGTKKSAQLKMGTIVVQSSAVTSCEMLQWAESLTAFTKSFRHPILLRLYNRLNNPKHQSGENLVCPTTKKLRVIWVCQPVITRHAKYHSIMLFLFWPVQLSACRKTSVSPWPWFSKK